MSRSFKNRPKNTSSGMLIASESRPPWQQNRGAAIIASLIGLFIAGISLVETEWIWLKILVAPKLYLIEYAASLVK